MEDLGLRRSRNSYIVNFCMDLLMKYKFKEILSFCRNGSLIMDVLLMKIGI